MQPDNKYADDLDYLSQQGFERVQINNADVEDLVRKTRVRSFSYSSGPYFGFIGLIVGVFIGISLFFVLDRETPEKLSIPSAPVIAEEIRPAIKPIEEIQLDTVVAVNENFIASQTKQATDNAVKNEPSYIDSVVILDEKPLELHSADVVAADEEHLKFIANAPVIYIHDLKVTDYRTLYFRNNHFVRFEDRVGTSADRAGRPIPADNARHLKQEPDYFLHEELAKGLLYFKKGKYGQCISALNTVASYNDKDINCDFYLAMCYYYRHNYEAAIGLFDECIADKNNTFLQEAQYYTAVSLYESGEQAEARELFQRIADDDLFYAGKAKSYLK